MAANVKILNAVKFFGGTVLMMGIMMFFIGFFASGYNILTPIGMGTIIGAVFIFLMGVFFVATEEMLEKRFKGVKVTPMK